MNGFIFVILLFLFIPINGYPGTNKIDTNAFRQSEKLLKLAATELVDAITASDYPKWKEFPDRKKLLLNILPYENLVKFPGKDEIYKNGALLSMDHQINPNLIIIYKPFFVMYAGTSDSEFEKKAVEVKKDLLMEASLTWGFDENQAEAFADDFLQIKKATSKKLRPEDSIFVKPDYCSCLDSKPDINNQCTSFCKGIEGGPTLYGSVILGEKVILDETLGSLERWCNAEISGTHDVSPKCVLEVDDGKNKEYLDMTLPSNSNNFIVNVNTLKLNVTYVARIVETGSLTNNASSDSFQIRRILPPVTNHFPGPLKITSINQYACITRIGESDPNTRSNYFNSKAKNHYYYEPRQKPPVGPPNAFVYCYDRDQYGPIDRITYPRLELVPKAFSVWDQNDIRFSDTNNDGNKDINTLIDTEMSVKYGIEAKTDYFVPFRWPTAPSISAKGTSEAEGEAAISTLGYMMRVFIDPYTGVGKCPTQEDYFGPDVKFQALRGVVGVDTEAIYIGVREKQTLNNPDGTTTEMPQDIILINESELKRIWFYIENNLKIKPDDVTSSQQTIYFYYPPAPEYMDPYVQKSFQELYTVRDRGFLGETAQTNENTRGTIAGLPSYDKRFGCIPSNGRNSPSGPTDSVNAQIEADFRFSTMKARYFCQAEGKQQNPNFELACNNKFLCTKLWKNSEPSFNGNCSDLDRREGLERYKENQITIVKDCGCRAENYPQSVDDKRCPDFKFKAIRDENGIILEIVCSLDDNEGANNLPNAENK